MKYFPYISNGEALEMHASLQPFPGLKSHMSVVDAFTVITSYLVGWKVISLEKNPF